MYHYVRDFKNSAFPRIKALSSENFRTQIGHIRKNYRPISLADLLAAIKTGGELPKKAVLLTFDDGYKDHFINVLPVLDRYKIQGSFFPPAKAILEHKVLDVNKIHFILASAENKREIVDYILAKIKAKRFEFKLETAEFYYNKFAAAGRFDDGPTVFIKKILQKELPEKLRAEIIDWLFKKFVSLDESGFAEELYLNLAELKSLRQAGMHIGGHGYSHLWLGDLKEVEQSREIKTSLAFLKQVGVDVKNWAFSYPYGSYNENLLALLKKNGCQAGFGVEARAADLGSDNPLVLPRLDTNDLPIK